MRHADLDGSQSGGSICSRDFVNEVKIRGFVWGELFMSNPRWPPLEQVGVGHFLNTRIRTEMIGTCSGRQRVCRRRVRSVWYA